MSADVKNLTKDIQDRIRDLAYLMWESAGKQQNIALQYWLNAEREVLSSMQAITEVMLPTQGQQRKTTQNPAQTATPSPVDPIEAPQTEAARTTIKTPTEPKSRQSAATRNAAPVEAAASTDTETPAPKPARVKAGSRRKTTK